MGIIMRLRNKPTTESIADSESVIVEEIFDVRLSKRIFSNNSPSTGSTEAEDNDSGRARIYGRTESGRRTEESEFERFRDMLQTVPDSILHLLKGLDRPGDCGRPSDQKPDWFDVEKIRRGQKFAVDNLSAAALTIVLGIFASYSFVNGLRPFIFTGKSSTPYTAFKRIFSTVRKILNWYKTDLYTKDSIAWKGIVTVRAMHAAVSRRMDGLTDEEIVDATKIPNPFCPARDILLKDFSEACDAPAAGQCPYIASWNNPSRVKRINQMDMAITQWSFVGLIICFPESFGLHYAADEDLDDFCFFWRTVGYELGMEDEFNFCRGTLDDIRQRSRDLIETWVKPNFREITPEWEHMMRCLISGISVLLPLPCNLYKTTLLYLTDVLGLKMPRLYASLTYKDWIVYNIVKFTFKYGMKVPGVMRTFNFLMNYSVDRVKNFTPKELEALQIKLSKSF